MTSDEIGESIDGVRICITEKDKCLLHLPEGFEDD